VSLLGCCQLKLIRLHTSAARQTLVDEDTTFFARAWLLSHGDRDRIERNHDNTMMFGREQGGTGMNQRMKTPVRVMLATGLIAGAIGCLESPDAADSLNGEPTEGQVYAEFEAVVDTANGTFEVTMLDATTGQALEPATVVQDGTPGTGPVNTVELVTTGTGQGAGTCGVANSFCANVVLRSFYTGVLANSTVQLTDITPFAGHAPLNSDPPFMGLSNTFGLWVYGNLAAFGGSNNRQWTFQNDGTAFRIRGRVMADLPMATGNSTTFSQNFNGVSAFGPQLDTFQAALSASTVYTTLTFSGPNFSRTCTGAGANTLCQAMRTFGAPQCACPTGEGTTLTCDGATWAVGQCGGMELTVGGGADTCGATTSPTLRPEIGSICGGNANWGGFGGSGCPGSPSGVYTITCTP
jgi:hypothetical protein